MKSFPLLSRRSYSRIHVKYSILRQVIHDMPIAVINVIVDEYCRFPGIEGLDIGEKDGEIRVMDPDPSMRYRKRPQKECSRIQYDHSGYDRQIGLLSIPLPEFVPDKDEGKGCEDEESREEDEDIPRVVFGQENEKIKHHGWQDPKREKKRFRRIERFQFSPSRQQIYCHAKRKQAGAESENNESNQSKEKTEEGKPFPSQ